MGKGLESRELEYMPVVDREKSTLSHHGAMKVLKHMNHHKGVRDAETMDMPIVDREKDAMNKNGK